MKFYGTPPTRRATQINQHSILGLPCIRIGCGDDDMDVENRFHEVYGIGADGAVLIRPDGFIAWRSCCAVSSAQTLLRDVLTGRSLKLSEKHRLTNGDVS